MPAETASKTKAKEPLLWIYRFPIGNPALRELFTEGDGNQWALGYKQKGTKSTPNCKHVGDKKKKTNPHFVLINLF